jgi:hypothetical protein
MAFIQHGHNSAGGAGTTTIPSVAMGSNVTNGNVLVWICAYTNASQRTLTLSGGGLTYTEMGVFAVGGDIQYHWGYAKVTSTQALTVTGSVSNSVTYPGLYVMERDDIDYTTPATAGEYAAARPTGPGTLSSGSTPTLTYANSIQIGFGINYISAVAPTATAGYTDHGTIWNFGGGSPWSRVVSKLLSSTTAVSTTVSASTSEQYDVVTLIFKQEPVQLGIVKAKQYSNGAFQATRFVEASTGGNIKMKLYANGDVQIANLAEVSGSPNKLHANGTHICSQFIEA